MQVPITTISNFCIAPAFKCAISVSFLKTLLFFADCHGCKLLGINPAPSLAIFQGDPYGDPAEA